LYTQQVSKYQRHREAAQKPEGVVVAEAEGPNTQVDGRDRNLDKTAGGRNKDQCVGDTTKENSLQSQQQRPKDNSSRRPRDNKDTEKVRVNVSSREFVRGGRGRLRGSARGRGRGDHQDVYGSASQKDVESVSQHGSADDASSARVASVTSAATRSNGTDLSRSGACRTEARQSKNEDRKSSHEALVGPTTVSAEDRQNDRGTAQLPADDQGRETQGVSNTRGILAKDTGRRSGTSAQTSRPRTEFYDSRNRGQKIRRFDPRRNDASKPLQQPKRCDAKVFSCGTPSKDGADVQKNATESSQNIADASSNKCSSETASEQTSQRKSGEKV